MYLKSATWATGALLRLHCKPAYGPLPLPNSVYNYSQLVVLLNISLFCIYNKLDRKNSQMHHIIKKGSSKSLGPLGSTGSNLRLCAVCEDRWSQTGWLTVFTMLNVWLRNYFIQALLPVGVVVQNKASFPVIVCACTMVLPLINNHQ